MQALSEALYFIAYPKRVCMPASNTSEFCDRSYLIILSVKKYSLLLWGIQECSVSLRYETPVSLLLMALLYKKRASIGRKSSGSNYCDLPSDKPDTSLTSHYPNQNHSNRTLSVFIARASGMN